MPFTQESIEIMNTSVSEIQDQFNHILEYTQGYSIVSDELFEQWWNNKKLFGVCFGLILFKTCVNVSFILPVKKKT